MLYYVVLCYVCAMEHGAPNTATTRGAQMRGEQGVEQDVERGLKRDVNSVDRGVNSRSVIGSHQTRLGWGG
jgi:hypothetical protein